MPRVPFVPTVRIVAPWRTFAIHATTGGVRETPEDKMSKSQAYSGSCHCGKVRFEVTAEITKASACNCSICSRVGRLMVSVQPAQFQLHSGADAQTDYQFGKKTMHHLFCGTCGIHAFGRYSSNGEEKVVVNLRCLDGLDVDSLEVQKFDGKSY
jgi:hypothetical protein